MAIPTTYAELQTEVAHWLNRTDLNTDIPTFIDFAENRINRTSGISRQETESTITMTINQDNTDVPAGFEEDISMRYTGENFIPLTKVNIGDLDKYKDIKNQSRPYYYAVSEGKFFWNIKPDQAYQVIVRYSKKWDLATDTTNWLLTNYPDVYLYGALSEAGVFIDDTKTATWQSKFETALKQVQYQSTRKTSSNLRTDPALQYPSLGNRRFNVYTGY